MKIFIYYKYKIKILGHILCSFVDLRNDAPNTKRDELRMNFLREYIDYIEVMYF